ncbi:MAG: accessory factor UbiK family protein [Pseudomonadota bacterium]
MIRDRIIQQLSDQLGQLFTSISGGDSSTAADARTELQKSVQSVVQNVFSKLDLVTREEFDAQQEVLRKTRSRVEELEQELEQISSSLKS